MKTSFSAYPVRFILSLVVTLLMSSSCERDPVEQWSESVNPSEIISGISLQGIPDSRIIVGETPSFDVAVSLSGEAAKRYSADDAKCSATDDRLKVEPVSAGIARVTPLQRGSSFIRVSLGAYHKDFPVHVSERYYVRFSLVPDADPPGVYARTEGACDDKFAARCIIRLRVSGKTEDAKSEGVFKFSDKETLVLDAGKLLQGVGNASLMGIIDAAVEPAEPGVLIFAGRMEESGLVTRLSVKYPDGTVVPEGGYPEEDFPDNPGPGDDTKPGTGPGSGDDNPGTGTGEEGSDTTIVRIKDESLTLQFDREKLYSHRGYPGVYVTREGVKVGGGTVSVTGGSDVQIAREGDSDVFDISFLKPGDHVLTIEVSPDGRTTYWNEMTLHVISESVLLFGLYKYDESGPDENNNVCAALVYECRDLLKLKYSIRLKLTGKVFGGVSWDDVCSEKTVTLESSGRHVLAKYTELYSAASKHYLTKKIEVHIKMEPMSEDMDCLLKVEEGISALMSEFGDDVPVYINDRRISGEDAVWMRL